VCDEEMRCEDESQRNLQHDKEMKQQLSEITGRGGLLAHHEEWKIEMVDERWRENMAKQDEQTVPESLLHGSKYH
jgi:hypothetical protein